MSEKKISLFELHFHESVQFGPRTLDGLGGGDEATDESQLAEPPAEEEPPALGDEPAEGAEGGSSLVRRLVGLGVLAGTAYAVRKLLDGEPSGLDALDDIETGLDDGIDAADEAAGSDEAVSIEVTSGEESGADTGSGRPGLAVAAVVALFVVVALAARKLLGDSVEEIEIPDELAEE